MCVDVLRCMWLYSVCIESVSRCSDLCRCPDPCSDECSDQCTHLEMSAQMFRSICLGVSVCVGVGVCCVIQSRQTPSLEQSREEHQEHQEDYHQDVMVKFAKHNPWIDVFQTEDILSNNRTMPLEENTYNT